jgi:hypothetical protein
MKFMKTLPMAGKANRKSETPISKFYPGIIIPGLPVSTVLFLLRKAIHALPG